MFSMLEGVYSRVNGAVVVVSEPARPPRRNPPARPPETFDAIIRRDAKSLEIDRLLWREQRKLRRLSSDAAWHQYLQVETAHMDRALRWLELGLKEARRALRRRR